MTSPVSFMKVRAIFITHLHGDHFYGLPGLLQTMGMYGRTEGLSVYGPEGFTRSLQVCLDACEGTIPYELTMKDMSPGETVDVKDLSVSAFATVHGIPSQGYVIREPDVRGRIDVEKAESLGISGKDFRVLEQGGEVNGVLLSDIASKPVKGASVAYTGDTTRCATLDEAVKDVDVLIHESTYMDSEKALADEHYHSTARSAAETARDAGVKALILIHVSNRYKDREVVRKEAIEVFRNTYAPEDFTYYRMVQNGVKLL